MLQFGEFTRRAEGDRKAETGNVTVTIDHEKLRLLIGRAFRNKNRRTGAGGGAFVVKIVSITPAGEVQTQPPAVITEPEPGPS